MNEETVRKLRDITGAGLIDTKKALIRANGDLLLAQGILKYQGCAINVRGMAYDDWVMERARSWATELRKKDG